MIIKPPRKHSPSGVPSKLKLPNWIQQRGPSLSCEERPFLLMGPSRPMQSANRIHQLVWIELALPLRLESKANSRAHWSRRATDAKQQRGLTYMVLRNWTGGAGDVSPLIVDPIDRWWPNQRITVEITRVAPRALDSDNLVSACKSVRDGVADWLGVNDRSDRVMWECRQRKAAPRTYGVEIRIGRWA